jgi:hypothetical protein
MIPPEFIIWLILIAVFISRDWYTIEREKLVPNYPISVAVRLLAGAIVNIIYSVLYEDLFSGMWVTWSVTFAVFQAGSFWFLFDTGLNASRGKAFDHVGENSKIDALQQKAPFFFWIVKLMLFISATAIYLQYEDL